METIEVNLLKTESYEDGKRRHIGMYGNGMEAIYLDANKLFESIREKDSEVEIVIQSLDLSDELKKIGWFQGRSVIEESELIEIVKEQKEKGYGTKLNYRRNFA